MYTKRLTLSKLLPCSFNHGSEVLAFDSIKLFMYHMIEFVKTGLCCKENYSSILFVKILRRSVVTFHELLSIAQQMNIQNQQDTLPTMKRVKCNKTGQYLVIKFLSRTEYKDDHAVLTVQKTKVFHLKFLQEKKTNPQETADLFAFTKENLNGISYFLCKVSFFHLTFKIMLIRYNTLFYELCTIIMLCLSNYFTKFTCQKICPNKALEANIIFVK